MPLAPRPVVEAELKECTCWDWKGLAQDEGEDAAAWLTDFLGKPARLVRYIGALLWKKSLQITQHARRVGIGQER